MIRYCAIIFLFFTYLEASSQAFDKLDFNFRYGIDYPSLDMGERFGQNYSPELGLQFSKNNIFYGIHGGMMLGPIVKEDVISNIRDSEGFLISQQEDLAIITMKQRGFILGLHGGTFIPLLEKSGTHGIRLRLGVNVLTHYIIFNNETASTNQLLGQYGKGYDRLSRGFGIEEFIGYEFISISGKAHFFVGINGIQARTKNLRPYNFDTRERDTTPRFDVLTGLRLGISINLYDNSSSTDVFY